MPLSKLAHSAPKRHHILRAAEIGELPIGRMPTVPDFSQRNMSFLLPRLQGGGGREAHPGSR